MLLNSVVLLFTIKRVSRKRLWTLFNVYGTAHR